LWLLWRWVSKMTRFGFMLTLPSPQAMRSEGCVRLHGQEVTPPSLLSHPTPDLVSYYNSPCPHLLVIHLTPALTSRHTSPLPSTPITSHPCPHLLPHLTLALASYHTSPLPSPPVTECEANIWDIYGEREPLSSGHRKLESTVSHGSIP
jgi:hypothetical protein